MLYKVKTLQGCKLDSLNGEIGKAQEFYFDDQHWVVRYLVADSGNWLTGRRVLISPYALVAVSHDEQTIKVNLTKQQIEDSPALDSDKPVSRQFEESYHGYFGWPLYWGGPYMWGYSPKIVRDQEKWREYTSGEKPWNPRLRSTSAVTGYHIQSEDGEIGHVEDFIIDDDTWAIRYLIIDTQNWWTGKKVLVATKWIERVSWSESKIFINLSAESIRQSPEYSDKSLLTREYESKLHGHYNRQAYWIEEVEEKEHLLRQRG
jgi:uncharacterized protein YrrD